MQYAVNIFTPTNYKHSQVFEEVQTLIVEGLNTLGHNAVKSNVYDDPKRRNIILGGNLINLQSQERFTKLKFKNDGIFINLERFGHDAFNEQYLNILRNYEIWDFSQINLKRINELYNLKIKFYLPLGYTSKLETINKTVKKEIDILFVGSLSQRRKLLLQKIADLGIKVRYLFGVYGQKRDEIISKTKLMLNIHYHDQGSLEHARIFYYLINQKPVLSESSDILDENIEWSNAISLTSYDNLPYKALALLQNEKELTNFANNGYTFIKKQKFLEILKKNLA